MSDSPNPFAPPQTPSVSAAAYGAYPLASLGKRFLGMWIDGGIMGLVAMVGALGGLVLALLAGLPLEGANADEPGAAFFVTVAVAMLAVVPVSILQWYLVATRGQSIAKIVLGMRILKDDGTPCGFMNGVVLRVWGFAIISFFAQLLSCGMLGWVVTLVDGGMIFRDSRQTLHDVIASTIVVDV